jgi:hypothetical protein
MGIVHLFSYFFSKRTEWILMKFGSLFCQVHFILIHYNPCFLYTSDFTWCVVWQICTNILEELSGICCYVVRHREFSLTWNSVEQSRGHCRLLMGNWCYLLYSTWSYINTELAELSTAEKVVLAAMRHCSCKWVCSLFEQVLHSAGHSVGRHRHFGWTCLINYTLSQNRRTV